MLPFLPKITEVDSIHVLFEKLNMSWMIVCLIIVVVLYLMIKKYIHRKILDVDIIEKAVVLIFVFIILGITICTVLFIHVNTTNKNINKTPIKTVFSSYRIVKIKQPKESDSNITYDASGNKEPEKPKILFKVYLDKTKDVKTMELEDNVVLEVSKVNKDSFDIILPDEKVKTIKRDDALEVFNALNKIKNDEYYREIMKVIRTREVKEEK